MELLTIMQVAKAEKKSTRGVRKDVAAGRFGPDLIRLGRSVRIRADEFSAWIQAGAPGRDVWLASRDRKAIAG